MHVPIVPPEAPPAFADHCPICAVPLTCPDCGFEPATQSAILVASTILSAADPLPTPADLHRAERLAYAAYMQARGAWITGRGTLAKMNAARVEWRAADQLLQARVQAGGQ